MRKSFIGAAIAAVGLAACGASNNHTASPPALKTAAVPATVPASTTPASTMPPAPTVVVHTDTTHGAYLTDPAGRSLYVFSHDHGTTTACTGSCVTFWPAFASADPVAGPGVVAAELGTANGETADQVTYDGHLLYFFKGDPGPGTTNGLSIPGWFLVGPGGQAVGNPAPATVVPTTAPRPAAVTVPPTMAPRPAAVTVPPTMAPRPAPVTVPPTMAPRPAPAPAPVPVTRPTTPPVMTTRPPVNPIPQGDGGDHDGDNNGGPSDGDGTV